MPIKKYVAEKDTTIANAYKYDLRTRSTDANMGASDSLEVFSIYGQASSASLETSRILVQFPIDTLVSDRAASKIPASGSVNFVLRMYNVAHPYTTPKDYKAIISVVSQSWDEGYGLDMEGYTDKGWSTAGSDGGSGCTWIYAQDGVLWASTGSAYLTGSQNELTYSFTSGLEDIELDITNIVERWAASSLANNGLLIRLSSSYEDGSQQRSFYTKKFSARGSEYFFKRPSIEARWESVINDDRINFFASSSAFEASDNIMNLYFYNKPKGTLKNVVGGVTPGIKFYSNSALTTEISSGYAVVTNPSTGVYKAQVAVDTTASVLYDKWYNTGSNAVYFSGSLDVYQPTNYDFDRKQEYVVNITNLKVSYGSNENARFKIFVRDYDWSPTIYTVSNNIVENTTLNNLYYKIFRFSDNYVVVDYSTGSLAYTKTSYDSNGNYFDFDMSSLQSGFTYAIKLATYQNSELKELKNTFKFKVE